MTVSAENAERAARAASALADYLDDTTDSASVIDLLTDLRHWCDQNNVDIYSALETSYGHYLAEKENSDVQT